VFGGWSGALNQGLKGNLQGAEALVFLIAEIFPDVP
jgi:hypothetical protein